MLSQISGSSTVNSGRILTHSKINLTRSVILRQQSMTISPRLSRNDTKRSSLAKRPQKRQKKRSESRL